MLILSCMEFAALYVAKELEGPLGKIITPYHLEWFFVLDRENFVDS